MNDLALAIGFGLSIMVLAAPGGVLVGLAGVRAWRWFWIGGALVVLIDTVFFSNPGPKNAQDMALTALLFGSATLVEAAAVRAAVRALGGRRAGRKAGTAAGAGPEARG